jgi:hypothetical protein
MVGTRYQMSLPRMFAAITAALALLVAVGCQGCASGGSHYVAPHERIIYVTGHAGTIFVHVPVDNKTDANVPTSSPGHG